MSKLPTIHDIAREVGVSVSAVSHAFNRPEEISPDLRERILRVARQRGYRPDPRARGLRRGENSLIALAITNLANVYYAGIARAAQRRLAAQGYYLVVLDSDGTAEGEQRSIEAVRHERMAGAIADIHHLQAADVLHYLGGRPIVFITDLQESCAAPSVRLNNFPAAHAATTYLIEQGRRRIAHISGPRDHPSAMQRQAGYRRALTDLGLAWHAEVVGDYLFPEGHRAMERLLARPDPPDAVFAANDLMALGALSLLRERDIAIPDQIALVGFDNIEEAAWSVPPLTTIDQPSRQIGTEAASLLLLALQDPHCRTTVDVTCTLVRRGSA